MSKNKILESLILQLETIRSNLMASALEAKDAATNEESKAENKYDTRGLEASYLAGAQAKRATELTETIQQLSKLEVKEFTDEDAIQISALVTTELNGEEERNFFILPFAGGNKVAFESKDIMIVTPNSPVGRAMLGKRVGQTFELRTHSKHAEYEVLEVN